MKKQQLEGQQEREETFPTQRSEGDTEIGQSLLVSLHGHNIYIIKQKGTAGLWGLAWSWGSKRACHELSSGNGEGPHSSSWL